jgi:starvation-inducible DNA-binding protein
MDATTLLTKEELTKLPQPVEEEPSEKSLCEGMNSLLANMNVLAQKVKKLHWNVSGDEFFDIHDQCEVMYNYLEKDIDELAERVRFYGQFPLATFQEYLEHADIVEEKTNPQFRITMGEILVDLQVVKGKIKELYLESQEIEDITLQRELLGIMSRYEKWEWKMKMFMKPQVPVIS